MFWENFSPAFLWYGVDCIENDASNYWRRCFLRDLLLSYIKMTTSGFLELGVDTQTHRQQGHLIGKGKASL
jgi:hypothetical protein